MNLKQITILSFEIVDVVSLNFETKRSSKMSATNLITKSFNFYNEVPISPFLQKLLHSSEKTIFAVQTIRDIAVFTDKRILIADKQGVITKKTEYFSVPYKSIVTYSIETAGTFDLDSEIKLYLAGGVLVELKFFKNRNMNDLLFKVYHTISEFIMS